MECETWPPPCDSYLDYFLLGEGATGRLAEEAGSCRLSYTYDPKDQREGGRSRASCFEGVRGKLVQHEKNELSYQKCPSSLQLLHVISSLMELLTREVYSLDHSEGVSTMGRMKMSRRSEWCWCSVKFEVASS